MADRSGNSLGDMISQVVDDVVSSGDFETLNNSIRETIDAVFEELNIGGNGSGAGEWAVGGQAKNASGSAAAKWAGGSGSSQNGSAARPKYERKSWQTVIKDAMEAREKQLYTKNPAGQLSGPIFTAVGGVLAGVNGIIGLSGLIMAIGDPSASGFAASFFMLAVAAASGVLLKKGLDSGKRIKRFRTYVNTLGNRTYCPIKELAAAVNKSPEFVVDDLRKMIELKYFPHGRLDMQGTTLMLDDESYNQYLSANAAYLNRKDQEEAQKKKEQSQSIFATGNESAEVAKAMAEGEKYIRQIREANDAIPGEEISRKLDRLELLMKKIFTVLSQKPDQLPKLRKFMNYYMPTTDKLVQTYRELDAQPVDGENIQKAKRDIEETLDTINDAYEKLLDNFFEEAAMDVSTDITVLQGLMAQEGLTAQPFGSAK